MSTTNVAMAMALVAVVSVGAAPTADAAGTTGQAATAPAAPAAEENCEITEILVNPCRPWLGAVADHYPGLATWRDQLLGHEQRIGRSVDVVHGYHPAGKVRLTADERYVVDRGSILYLNWKPANTWADATGGNAAIDAQIDTMAAEIKSLGSSKIMLALFGEPERYVTPGTSTCGGLRGSTGSPAEYRAMWAHVQDRFDAAGVTNVVWVMNYLGYYRWHCLFPELWPGNDRVDWVMWDPYVGPRQRFDDEVGYFYRALEEKTDADHAFTSKPWGLAEFGYWYGTDDQTEAYRFYDDARTFLNSGDYPRLKLYEIYDTVSEGIDVRVGYTANGVLDPVEQSRYNAFANDPMFSDGSPPDPDPGPDPVPTDHFAGCDTSGRAPMSGPAAMRR